MDSLSPRWPEDNGEETPGKLGMLKVGRLLSGGITLEAREMEGDCPSDGFDQPGYCDLKVNLEDLAQGKMIAPTASLGFFMEFDDEAGIAGGLTAWLGGCLFPDVEPHARQTTGFVSFGVQLRTGMLPILTGPIEVRR